MRQIVLVILIGCAFHSFAQKKPVAKTLVAKTSVVKKPVAEKPVARWPANPYAATDKKALQLQVTDVKTSADIAAFINANFSTATDKVRAAYIWIGSNIDYDSSRMGIRYNDEKPKERIARTLANRKGICADYAALFSDVCDRCGIESYVISGYVKVYGMLDDSVSHAWSAAKIGGTWYLFDPTWGAGHVDKKGIKEIDNVYFKVSPLEFIKSHMPFDPMWQFLNYPISNEDFYAGRMEQDTGVVALDSSKPYFSYVDSIAVYNRQDSLARKFGELRRITANGRRNRHIERKMKHLRRYIEYCRTYIEVSNHNRELARLNLSVAEFNDAANLFNQFTEYRSHRFQPAKPDSEIVAMINVADKKLSAAKALLADVQHIDAELSERITSTKRSIAAAQLKIDKEKKFLEDYLSKDETHRRIMLYQY